MVGERGFEPPTPWSRKRNSGVVLNVINLLQWCFNRLIPTQSPHSGVNVSPRMAVPDQGFTLCTPILWLGTEQIRPATAPLTPCSKIYASAHYSKSSAVPSGAHTEPFTTPSLGVAARFSIAEAACAYSRSHEEMHLG